MSALDFGTMIRTPCEAVEKLCYVAVLPVAGPQRDKGCVVSLLFVMENGASAEIAVVGNEGIVGVAVFMGGETMQHLPLRYMQAVGGITSAV